MNDYLKRWIKAAGIRALKTVGQTAASLITVGALASDINWKAVLSAALVAGVYSLFTSLGGLPELSDSRSKTDNGEGDGE